MKKLSQPYCVEIAGKTFCLGHGDGLGPVPFGYRFLRGLFHNRLAQFLFSLLHPWIAFRFGNGWSKGNRLSHDKEYVAGITFGATTPSYDLEKEIDRFFPHEHITASSVADALPAFIGEQDQIAPLFSAKSVDGVRAYELARKLHREGKTLDEAAAELIRVSRINITELECIEFIGSGVASEDPRPVPAALTHPLAGGGTSSPAIARSEGNASSRINVTDNSGLGLPRAVVRMACSKGTYVRAFARDLGEALGSGAHLDALQRSRSGIFRVENALTVDQAIQLLSNA